MAKCFVEDTSLTNIANKIREKSGETEQLVFPTGFISAIEGLEDVTPEVTAQTPIIAEIAEKFGVSITTPSGTNKQILQGNNENLQKIEAIPEGALSDITVSSAGLITAKVGTAGYLEAGTSKTKQLTQQAAKTWTPTTADQSIASGRYLTGKQTIKGDANLIAANIRRGKTIFGVTGTFEKLTLEELSWAEISEIINSGGAKSWFSLKDSKTVTLTSGEQIVVEIAGFNIDTYTAGGTAPVTFLMRNCLNTKRAMNSANTNSGGWNGSEMRTYCNGELYNLFPADLRGLIKPVNKKTSSGNKSATIQTTSDKLWLPSGCEVSGSSGNAKWFDGEGTQYPIFTDNASRIKYIGSTPQYWWLRSPQVSSAAYWCRVRTDGDTSWQNANTAYGVVAGFCI